MAARYAARPRNLSLSLGDRLCVVANADTPDEYAVATLADDDVGLPPEVSVHVAAADVMAHAGDDVERPADAVIAQANLIESAEQARDAALAESNALRAALRHYAPTCVVCDATATQCAAIEGDDPSDDREVYVCDRPECAASAGADVTAEDMGDLPHADVLRTLASVPT